MSERRRPRHNSDEFKAQMVALYTNENHFKIYSPNMI